MGNRLPSLGGRTFFPVAATAAHEWFAYVNGSISQERECDGFRRSPDAEVLEAGFTKYGMATGQLFPLSDDETRAVQEYLTRKSQ